MVVMTVLLDEVDSMKSYSIQKVLIVVAVISLFGLAWHFGLQNYLTLEKLKEHQAELQGTIAERPLQSSLTYLGIYIFMAAVSFPGALVMTLAGGAIFGLIWGTLLVSFASTIGATLSFLAARFLLRDWVRQKFGARIKDIESGFERDGIFYLFSLRLIPLFPFFVVNLLMGLTPMPVWQYFIVSQIGMLPATIVYVNAGEKLSSLNSLVGILQPQVLLSFVLIGILPWIAKLIQKGLRR